MKKKFLAFGCDVAKIGAFALALGFVACGDDSSSGSDDSSLIPVESEIDLVGGKKVSCDEKMEGVVAALANGDFRRCDDGAWVKISREEALKADEILGYSSSSVQAGSSSSAKVTSSSSAKVVGSSSSGTPAVDPDPVPEIYECPDGSFVEVEEDCPSAGSSSSEEGGCSSSVSPDPVPGSNSSSEDDVKPDGYYSNSENCPAGLTCKYATTTDYLNSTKTYGEILDTRDGQVYKTIKICDKDNKNCQTWMAQNLNYGNVESWCGGGSGSMEGNCSKYGRLYTWEVAMDKADCGYGNECDNSYEGTQGVCPSGWHLPSKADWRMLIKNVGGTDIAGSELKSASGWNNGGNGANSFGFAVLPAGARSDGDFYREGDGAYFWSSTEYNSNSADNWYFLYLYDNVDDGWNGKGDGFSVRCFRNSNPDVTPDPVPGSNSSTSEGDEGGEGSSPSVDPGTDPGSNSSTSEEDVAAVQPDGFYSNSSNCPEGLDCKYATTTDYLNPDKTYGEILDTRDGQVYKTIKICDKDNKNCQTWMAQNLNYGDVESWCGGGSGTTAGDCSIYGRLYTWAAAVDSGAIYEEYGEECGYGKSCPRFSASALATAPVRGVCPSGWHLPSDAEWSALYTNVGYAAQKLKANTGLWYGITGTDEYGFSVLPAGSRSYYGNFSSRGYYAYFWSSTEDEDNSNYAWNQYFYCYDGNVSQDDSNKYVGFSVRCLRD